MSDLPENLQVIKRESSSPSTPEDKSSNNIKAKLNLHVKRRLQDFAHNSEDTNAEACSSANVDIKPKLEQLKTETTRQKRPYHKKTDKTPKAVNAGQQQSQDTTASQATTPQRKYKHKLKQIVSTGNVDNLTPNSLEESLHNAGAVSAGDDDDGGHDDLKGKEKEKCPDVLAMVLSMKKRALMQDPEVQSFLKDVMEAIKS